MSLVCHECKNDLQPGDDLPGREGGMVNPNLLVKVCSPSGVVCEHTAMVETRNNRALCFRCITKHLTRERLQALNAVFGAYTLEVDLRRRKDALYGISIKPHNAHEFGQMQRVHELFRSTLEPINLNECLCCGSVIARERETFFTFNVMDRVYAERYASGFSGSYQFSDLRTGKTEFSFCFNCCKKNFPLIFRQFGEEFCGNNLSAWVGK